MNDIAYQSFRRARELLEAAVVAHGGELDVDVSASFTGTLIDEGHYDVPYAVHDYAWRGNLTMRKGGAASRRVVFDQEPGDGDDALRPAWVAFSSHDTQGADLRRRDRKSTRLNSSHSS